MKIQILTTPYFQKKSNLIRFINKLPDIFETEGELIFKKRNTIKKFNLNIDSDENIDFIVKKYKRPNFLQKIIYSFFERTKAERSFYNAVELHKRDVNTPTEAAFLNIKKNGLLQEAYYISLPDYSPPIKLLFDRIPFDKLLAIAFGKFAAQLHLKGILHHDLNSTNVLYKETDGIYSFSIIDINRMDFYPLKKSIPLTTCYNNLTRFCGNMELFEEVLKAYIEERQLPNPIAQLKKAINIKIKHDKNWKRRKDFFRKFKKKEI